MRLLTTAVITGNSIPNKQNYYETVYALTPKEGAQSQVQAATGVPPVSQVGPLVAFAPIIIFFALFIGAFGIQVVQRALTVKRTVSALVIALFVASTPYVLGSVRTGTRFQSHAGPEEVPRRIEQIVSGTELTVSWFTDSETVGAVRIGTSPLSEDSARVVIAGGGKKMQDHAVTITKLKAGYLYELEIFSNTRWYDNRGEPLRITTR